MTDLSRARVKRKAVAAVVGRAGFGVFWVCERAVEPALCASLRFAEQVVAAAAAAVGVVVFWAGVLGRSLAG